MEYFVSILFSLILSVPVFTTHPVFPGTANSREVAGESECLQKLLPVEKLEFLDKDANSLHLVIFLGTDCPISQKYMYTLRELYDEFGDNVAIYGLVPKNFNEEQIIGFKTDYRVPFKLIRDDENRYSGIMNATVTPEVFLFDRFGYVHYDGAIDNWFFALGRNRLKPTEHYLKDAISQVLASKTVDVKHKDAIGCLIEKKH